MPKHSQIIYLGGPELWMGNVSMVPYCPVWGSSIPHICFIRIMAQARKAHVIMKKEKNWQHVLIKLEMTTPGNLEDLIWYLSPAIL